jgi:hypothetical protein
MGNTRNAGQPDAINGFAERERIVPRRSTITPTLRRFDYDFRSRRNRMTFRLLSRAVN